LEFRSRFFLPSRTVNENELLVFVLPYGTALARTGFEILSG